MTKLWRSPLFLAGLAIKLVAVVALVPAIQERWFVPFLAFGVHHPSLDPWTAFLAAGGDPMAFPYGPVMFLAHMPLAGLGAGLDTAFGTDALFTGLGFRLTLLIADVAAIWALLRIAPARAPLLISAFWLSPLSLFITYWHGQTDIVPVAILLLAFAALKKLRAGTSGLLFALAVSAKLSMALSVPFVLIYLARNSRLQALLKPFVIAGAAAGVGLLLPWALLSPGFGTQVLSTPEALRLYALRVTFASDAATVYVVPLIYSLMLYGTWRLRRSNFQLLVAISGVCFMAVVLGTLGAPGWYMWVLPFLALSLKEEDTTGILVFSAFVVTVVLMLALTQSGSRNVLFGLSLSAGVPLSVHSLWITLVAVFGIILMLHMYREGVQGNDFYRLSRRPLAIGIAGDSGVGKDTLVQSLTGLFGSHSVTTIHGDSYHKWDRGAPMWKVLTHLNPGANDLTTMTRDTLTALAGRSTQCRFYDHATGRFALPTATKSRDCVIAAGLHTLLSPSLYHLFDVRVFLDATEDLRTYWKLRRDSGRRGQSEEEVRRSIAARHGDAAMFVKPQADRADIVFTVAPVNPEHLVRATPARPIPLKLTVLLREALYADRLTKALIGICALRIDQSSRVEGNEIEMVIEGEVSPDDVALTAQALIPDLSELLDVHPQWMGDVLGIMQITLLLQIQQSLYRRMVA